VSDDPFQRFEAEHQEALGQLDRLEVAARGLRARADHGAQFEVARAVHQFLIGAVRAHNDREERALFPLLGDEAPTGLFVEEHGTLRGLERELDAALQAADAERSAAAALALVDLLRAHIAREDVVLFPVARARLGDVGLRELARRLDGTG